MKKVILLAGLLLIPTLALGAEPRPDRPHWSLELKGGAFFPAAGSWSKFYGSDFMGEYGGALSYKVTRQLEVGLEGTYARATGKGGLTQHQTLSGSVNYQQAPVDVFILGRAVLKEDQLLVPYAGGGYTRMFYREQIDGQGKTQGSVNGYHGRAGVQLLLDRFESDAAENLYKDYGLHHTYFFMEGKYTRAMADTNPSGSVNIGGASALAGFMFEF